MLHASTKAQKKARAYQDLHLLTNSLPNHRAIGVLLKCWGEIGIGADTTIRRVKATNIGCWARAGFMIVPVRMLRLPARRGVQRGRENLRWFARRLLSLSADS